MTASGCQAGTCTCQLRRGSLAADEFPDSSAMPWRAPAAPFMSLSLACARRRFVLWCARAACHRPARAETPAKKRAARDGKPGISQHCVTSAGGFWSPACRHCPPRRRRRVTRAISTSRTCRPIRPRWRRCCASRASGPGDFVIDLGSGDGRILITAVEEVRRARLWRRSRSAAGEGKSCEREARGGVRSRPVPPAQPLRHEDRRSDGRTLYLLPRVNIELRPRLLAELKPGTRVVSHDFDMGDWKPDLRATVRGTSSTVYYWLIPAQAGGLEGPGRHGARQRGVRVRRSAEVPGDQRGRPARRQAGGRVEPAAGRRRDRRSCSWTTTTRSTAGASRGR